jgi:hypothetical protein
MRRPKWTLAYVSLVAVVVTAVSVVRWTEPRIVNTLDRHFNVYEIVAGCGLLFALLIWVASRLD